MGTQLTLALDPTRLVTLPSAVYINGKLVVPGRDNDWYVESMSVLVIKSLELDNVVALRFDSRFVYYRVMFDDEKDLHLVKMDTSLG